MWITILTGTTCLVLGTASIGALAYGRSQKRGGAVAPVGAGGLSSQSFSEQQMLPTATHLACSMAVAYVNSAVLELERYRYDHARVRLDRAEEELQNAQVAAEDPDTKELITPVIARIRDVRGALPSTGPEAVPELKVIAGALRALAAREATPRGVMRVNG